MPSNLVSLLSHAGHPPLFGRAGLGELLASTEVGTHKHLALLLGGARGLPPALSAELAGAFDETWGYWSHDQRLSGAR